MKQFYLLFTFLSLLTLRIDAQQGGPLRVQALRVAFITERLDLTPAEAQVFWPVYNEYQDKREALRKESHENRRKVREQGDQLSDEELLRLADEEMRIRQEDVRLQSELHEKLKKILPAKKLAQLYIAEEDFKKKLVKMVTEENTNEGENPTKTGKGDKR